MIALALPFNRKAKVWVGDQPGAVYVTDRTVTHILEAKPSFTDTFHRGAVELYVPTGPRSIYGLLGAEFKHDKSNKVSIRVNVSSDRGPRVIGSLAEASDDVRIGLPEDYVEGVLRGVLLAQQQVEHLLSGDVVFNCAAYGVKWSNKLIFSHLSSILLKILIMNNDEFSEEKLALLFQLTF
jgi:hypothetical protein